MTRNFSKGKDGESAEGFKNGESIKTLAQKFECSYTTMRCLLEKKVENYKKIAKEHSKENALKSFERFWKNPTKAMIMARQKNAQKMGQLSKTEKQLEACRKNGEKASAKANPSKPEILFSLILANKNIQFMHQFSIFYRDINDKKRVWHIDFFIFPNIIVQLDGVYYHCRIEKGRLLHDWLQNLELRKQGYKVIRFWEFEITDNLEKCIKKVKKLC